MARRFHQRKLRSFLEARCAVPNCFAIKNALNAMHSVELVETLRRMSVSQAKDSCHSFGSRTPEPRIDLLERPAGCSDDTARVKFSSRIDILSGLLALRSACFANRSQVVESIAEGINLSVGVPHQSHCCKSHTPLRIMRRS